MFRDTYGLLEARLVHTGDQKNSCIGEVDATVALDAQPAAGTSEDIPQCARSAAGLLLQRGESMWAACVALNAI